jgi:DNA topoisomerase IA
MPWKPGSSLIYGLELLSPACKLSPSEDESISLRNGRQFHTASFPPAQYSSLTHSFSGIYSTGPCQFPTLGFVVSRYKLVKKFVPEPFWKIDLSLSRPMPSKANTETHFNWKRGHIFDFDVVVALYQHVLSNPMARVVKVTNKSVKKWYVP